MAKSVKDFTKDMIAAFSDDGPVDYYAINNTTGQEAYTQTYEASKPALFEVDGVDFIAMGNLGPTQPVPSPGVLGNFLDLAIKKNKRKW